MNIVSADGSAALLAIGIDSGQSGRAVIEIELQETGDAGRYTALVQGREEAGDLTYRKEDRATVIAEHTWVSPSQRGQGVAEALVKRLMDDARANGFRVVPRCSYVRKLAARHPEWDDLIQA